MAKRSGFFCLLTVLILAMTLPPSAASAARPLAVPLDEFVYMAPYGPAVFDPAIAYDTSSSTVISQVYETLITFKKDSDDIFIPQLADSWTVSPDGRTYTFHIRGGVKFHSGATLTAADVAYTFQRGILLGGYSSPQWLLAEPILGGGRDDITWIVDNAASANNRALLVTRDPAILLQACQTVKSAIRADMANSTVTFTLAGPWSPFLATLAGSWGSIMNQAWLVNEGAWNGDCATWQNYYDTKTEETPIRWKMNGTGPYQLGSYSQTETILTRNPLYWRTQPGWEGGPSGVGAFAQVRFIEEMDEAVRTAAITGGNADLVAGIYDPTPLEAITLLRYRSDGTVRSTGVENGTLAAYDNLRSPAMDTLLFNYRIEPSPLIGSATLGGGIPADFFSDVHVRRGMLYAFNWDQLNNELYGGTAIRPSGPILEGLPGAGANQPRFSYDPLLAADEFRLARDGQVMAQGFQFTCVYTPESALRRRVCEILRESLLAISPGFVVNTVEEPWENYLLYQQDRKLPVMTAGWAQDIPHPHNWVQPFLTGTYANRQRLPQALMDKYRAMVTACLNAAPEQQEACYSGIQTETYLDATFFPMTIRKSTSYMNAQVVGNYHTSVGPGLYLYPLSKRIPPVVNRISSGDDSLLAFENQAGDNGAILIPANTLPSDFALAITTDRQIPAVPEGSLPAGLDFAITAPGGAETGIVFPGPIPITIEYRMESAFENTLRLMFWNGTAWKDAACGAYQRDLEKNRITVPICHFAQFVLIWEGSQLFLPGIRR